MITFTQIKSFQDTSASASDARYEIELPYDLRKKSRFKTQARSGEELGLMLPRGQVLRHGTLIENDKGDVAIIIAAHETVSTVTTHDPILLTKAAYHLGNRHVALQVGNGWLRYQHDHVLDDMITGLGLDVSVEQAGFEPEDGAYANGGHHHHH